MGSARWAIRMSVPQMGLAAPDLGTPSAQARRAGQEEAGMAPRPVTVSSVLQLRLIVHGAAALPVQAELSYDVADPYAVHVCFHTGGGAGDVVGWTFARQLLTDGIHAAAGLGDVRVWPSGSQGEQVVCLSLSSPSGQALFEVPLPELAEFLAMTYGAVAPGAEGEHVDVEAELALLLQSPGA